MIKMARGSWVRAWALTAAFCLGMGLLWGLSAVSFCRGFMFLAVVAILLIKIPARPVKYTGMTVTHIPATFMLLIVIALAVLVTMLVTGHVSETTVFDDRSAKRIGTDSDGR